MNDLVNKVLAEDEFSGSSLSQAEPTTKENTEVKGAGQKVDALKKELREKESKLAEAKKEAAQASTGKTGVSEVIWTADSQMAANTLLQGLFKEQLIADAQVMGENVERMFKKFDKEVSNDNLVMVKMFTADNRVQELV
jgi:hypothetical protein